MLLSIKLPFKIMMTPIRILSAAFVFCFTGTSSLMAVQQIAPDSKEITVKGAHYITKKDGLVCFGRFDNKLESLPLKEKGFNWKKAQSTTGVRIFFKTDSPKVTLLFENLDSDFNRGIDYGVFIDGKFFKSYTFAGKPGSENKLVIDSGNKVMKEYEVTLPTFANPRLKGLEIEDGCKLEAISDKKQKVYVAMGDSITHGQGQQNATYKTYPYLLSKKLGVDYYNLAVGGGKISMLAAKQLKDWYKIDLMTILIGYNDWVFDGKTPDSYKKKYREFLKEVRLHHPETKIFCISLLYTKNHKSRKTGEKYQPDDYRKALKSLVQELQEAGDKNLFFIAGDQITSIANLQGDAAPKDMVHLGIPGAKMFAEELYKKIHGKF